MCQGEMRLPNLIGALSVAVDDRVNKAFAGVTALGGEAPAAIIQIGQMPNLTISNLSRILGLSHSATVRIVSKLLEGGLLVKDRQDGDARNISLNLTTKGAALMSSLLSTRLNIIASIADTLPASKKAELEDLLAMLLGGFAKTHDDAVRICRLCDEQACPQDACPVVAN
ncbi:DNA-binding MarR family transcriptional regulator [Rhizobium sp. BK650]|uniref:MarR family winged helix-turn-helix transcriptional regulator n=1 Tax=Rhizobium sp. BK650 TaxID=2586990 RepID=UPI00160B1FF0|nr:MarR family transcriptional regulator [Rhizobium sp. BK650]MBB3656484.1 DNA-binding MarR family transcriptional regulator [Rhizobium sp. BK650]